MSFGQVTRDVLSSNSSVVDTLVAGQCTANRVTIKSGASDGKVFTSDASGQGSWKTPVLSTTRVVNAVVIGPWGEGYETITTQYSVFVRQLDDITYAIDLPPMTAFDPSGAYGNMDFLVVLMAADSLIPNYAPTGATSINGGMLIRTADESPYQIAKLFLSANPGVVSSTVLYSSAAYPAFLYVAPSINPFTNLGDGWPVAGSMVYTLPPP